MHLPVAEQEARHTFHSHAPSRLPFQDGNLGDVFLEPWARAVKAQEVNGKAMGHGDLTSVIGLAASGVWLRVYSASRLRIRLYSDDGTTLSTQSSNHRKVISY